MPEIKTGIFKGKDNREDGRGTDHRKWNRTLRAETGRRGKQDRQGEGNKNTRGRQEREVGRHWE